MNKTEYREWAQHFSARFPATAQWLMNLPAITRDAWFEDVFSDLELRDCRAVNVQLVADGEMAAYDRERIPSIFIKRCAELRAKRSSGDINLALEQDFIRRSKRGGDGLDTIRGDHIMGRALRRVGAKMSDWKEQNAGAYVPMELIREWVSAEIPNDDDDPTDQPRYKCLTCRDSGYVQYRDSRERPCSGHCSCERGKQVSRQWDARGKSLGGAERNTMQEWVYN